MSAANPNTNTELFEKTPIPIACGKLIIPTVIGSLVAVLYSMADTYFVGALNSPPPCRWPPPPCWPSTP